MLGRLEEGVLIAILAAAHEPTATQLHDMLSPIFDRVSPGSVHVTLERLERKGMVTRRLGDPAKERGGKAQYYYSGTHAAGRALAEAAILNSALGMLKRSKAAATEDAIAPIHPGKLLDDYLRQLEWPVAYAAARIGVTREHAYCILRGDVGISPATAKALARNNIGGSALDWLIRQAKFDLTQPEKPSTQRRRYEREPEC